MKPIDTLAADLVAKLKTMALHPSHYAELEAALADPARWATQDELAEARSYYESGDINFDDTALASRGESGTVWVQCWARVEANQ